MWNTGFNFRQLTFNGFRLKGSWFILDIRKKLFIVRVVTQWNREVVNAPPLEWFKARWDGALSNQVLCPMHTTGR